MITYTRELISRKSFIFYVLFFLMFYPSLSLSEEKAKNPVVARVNGVEITRSDMFREVNKIIPQTLYHGTVDEARMEQFRKEAVNNLILEELQYEDASKRKIPVSDREIENEIKKIIREKYENDEEKFNSTLKRYNIKTEDVKSTLKRRLLVRKIVEKMKDQPIALTEGEVKKYYDENQEKFIEPEKYRLRQILIKVDPVATTELANEIKKKAEKVLRRVKKGEDFAKVALEVSDDETRERGGDLGYIHKGRLKPEIEKAVEKLKVNEISNIISTIYGYHIVKLEGIKKPKKYEYEEIKEKLTQDLNREAKAEAFQKWIEDLKSKAKIEVYESLINEEN